MVDFAFPPRILFTRHACCRMRQRAIPPRAVAFALAHGQVLHLRRGYLAVFLGRRALRKYRFAGDTHELEALVRNGLVLILSPDRRRVVTAYRCDRPASLRRCRR